MEYGYCRISTAQQNIDRQVRNILSNYPKADIVEEVFTGTKTTGRKGLERIISKVREGDTIIFDSVSRMSRNADEGIKLYMELYDKGVNLVFLNEPQINTDTYRSAIQQTIKNVGNEIADIYIEATNKVLMIVAQNLIRIAFEQAEKEVTDLRQRTREGMETARLNGKQIGQRKGRKLNVKKEAPAKQKILKYSKEFGGALPDNECIKVAGVSRATYYKYKQDLLAEALKKTNDEQ